MARMDHHIVLVHVGQRLPRPPGGQVEGVSNHPLHTEGGIHADLVGDLMCSPRAHCAAVADVRTFGALAHHHEVHVTGVGQRGGHARHDATRPQVDVVVEAEPDLQQQATLEHAAGNTGVADRPEQDRVVAPQPVKFFVGQSLTGSVPAPGSKVILGGRYRDVSGLRGGLEDLQPFGHNFRADAVAADNGEVDVLLRHERHATTSFRIAVRESHDSGTASTGSVVVIRAVARRRVDKPAVTTPVRVKHAPTMVNASTPCPARTSSTNDPMTWPATLHRPNTSTPSTRTSTADHAMKP